MRTSFHHQPEAQYSAGRRFGSLKILGAALQADGGTRSPLAASNIRRRSAILDHSAGLDVSVKETSVCIVDDTGKSCGK